MAFLVGVFTFSILDKVIDFDEYDSFTLNGIDYAPPRRNSPSEDFELYDKMQKEYFDANNISFYGKEQRIDPHYNVFVSFWFDGSDLF